jgi:hypothetical protein
MKNIFTQVTELTGLPAHLVQKDLKKYLDSEGISENDLTIEDLRRIMIRYLSETVDETLFQE